MRKKWDNNDLCRSGVMSEIIVINNGLFLAGNG